MCNFVGMHVRPTNVVVGQFDVYNVWASFSKNREDTVVIFWNRTARDAVEVNVDIR